MAHVLIIDDERDLCNILALLLRQRGHEVQTAHSGEAGLKAASAGTPELVLLDLQLGDMSGLDVLRRLHDDAPALPVVMMTAYGNVQAAVEAMKLGAVDFVGKPFDNDALISTAEAMLELKPGIDRALGPVLIGESAQIQETLALTMRFAVPDISVLLIGETGTGKEVFARTIHAASKRRDGPFITVDCSTLAENLFESELFGHEKGSFTGAATSRIGCLELAQGGTLFLDEIGNLPVALQAKLLRVLQERSMMRVGGRELIRLDVRVISATNVDLEGMIEAGRFRQDIYYRLNEMCIPLPPLRDREGDALRMARYFVEMYCKQFGKPVDGISTDAERLINSYPWPGNVRELKNAMKAAVVLAEGKVQPQHLPPAVSRGQSETSVSAPRAGQDESGRVSISITFDPEAQELDLKALGLEASEQAERAVLSSLVERRRLSGAQLAKLVNLDPKTLRGKLRKYGLS